MSDAKATLNEFIAKVKQNGLLTASHFYVIIPSFGSNSNGKDLLMFCDAADLPGVTLMTTEIRQFGEFTTLPHAPMYQPIQLSFICDATMGVKNALESWIDSVFDRNTRTFNYYDSYTKDIEIYITDKNGKDVHKVTLYEAYPTSIGNIQLDYANEQIIKVPVTIAYKWWQSSFFANDYKGDRFSFNKQLPISVPVFAGSIRPGVAHYFNGTPFNGFEFMQANAAMSAETQNIFTGVTETGALKGNSMLNSSFRLITGNSQKDIQNFGYNVQQTFSRAGNSMAAAYMVAPTTQQTGAVYVSQMAIHSKSIASDMLGYSQGLIELGRNVSSITRPAGLIGTAVTSLGGTLQSIDGTLASLGITSMPFSKVARELYSTGGKIGVAANLRGLQGGLTTVGANMTATSSIFQQVQQELRGKEGYTSQIGDAFQSMSKVFSQNGTDTMNAANVLAVKAGEM